MKMYNCKASDTFNMDKLRERYLELAGMFKEKGFGNTNTQNKILAKFSLQEGVRNKKARQYFRVLVDAGLIIKFHGRKTWKYDSKAEWDLFKVEINI